MAIERTRRPNSKRTENSDPAVAEEFLAAENESCEWYGDSAYGTGDLRGAIGDTDGDEAVIKPKSLGARVEGGFTVDGFTVDEQGTLARSASNPGRRVSAPCAAVVRCAISAPSPKPAVKSCCIRETNCCAGPPVTGLPSPNCGRSTARSDPTWNGAWLTHRTAGLYLRNLVGRRLTRTAGVWVLQAQTS
jgi:hypothetical protein